MESTLDLMFLVSSVLLWILTLVGAVMSIVGTWKMFEKAGQPGWAALVPFYSNYKLFEISWGNGWLFLLMLVPVVSIVVQVIMEIKLAKAFGKGTGFAVGLIFMASIFYMILGFDNSEYQGPQQ